MRLVNEQLRELMIAHHVDLQLHEDGWLSTSGKYPICRAVVDEQVNPTGCSARLDVEVGLTANRTLVESFGDWGATPDAAVQQSFMNFSLSSLHVLLRCVWEQPFRDQFLEEEWKVAGRRWRMYLGNFVGKAQDGKNVMPPDEVYLLFQHLVQTTKFTLETHWGRIYYANVSPTDSVCEVLLDGEAWSKGAALIQNACWPKHNLFYSTRMFWMMEPFQS